ncbi:DUF6998 domain-containing protein [Sinorhizobium meliloti]|uniref:DUF6998 domain-containing protein n=1 Tax=Rhizobium meliloti TaxID=382 RepID=UPI000B4A36E1|nr:hypothetical protein [Sinorhizobium meliloti]ASP90295.1 hypothetical protein CDO25_03225 [Sinorhizobium meliloti]MQX59414.1 hypothetical protein [Sinorhizobium meliloti]
MRYKLPTEIRHLIHARNQLRARYERFGLKFTPDGNLVGDLGEAIAAELFDLQLVDQRGYKGIDAHTREAVPRSVQIKATGRGDSLIFTHTDKPANILIGLVLRYEQEEVEVVYNGPYDVGLFGLHTAWQGQRPQRVSRFRLWNANVRDEDRLRPMLPPLA